MVVRRILLPEELVRIQLPQPYCIAVNKFGKKDELKTATTGIEAAIESIDTVSSLMGKAWELFTANPYLTLLFGVGLLGIGFYVFRKVKRAVR